MFVALIVNALLAIVIATLRLTRVMNALVALVIAEQTVNVVQLKKLPRVAVLVELPVLALIVNVAEMS